MKRIASASPFLLLDQVASLRSARQIAKDRARRQAAGYGVS